VFSGETLYEQWIYQLFNIIFTSIPVMWFAIFDWQYDRDVLMKDPKLYAIGLYSKNTNTLIYIDLCFGKWQFWRWMFYGVIMALLLCFLPMYSIEGPRTND
jgi:phospholipid-transporting ATPase